VRSIKGLVIIAIVFSNFLSLHLYSQPIIENKPEFSYSLEVLLSDGSKINCTSDAVFEEPRDAIFEGMQATEICDNHEFRGIIKADFPRANSCELQLCRIDLP